MDEIIQIFVIKIAGQKTRQKDLKEEQHFKNKQTHLALNLNSYMPVVHSSTCTSPSYTTTQFPLPLQGPCPPTPSMDLTQWEENSPTPPQ